MKAMILAAGLGQRLRPITEHIPKALVPVAGRPMIEYSLRLLRSAGIREIIINVCHLGGQIEDYLGDGADLGLHIQYSREERLLDTGGGVLRAKPFLADGPFIVINSDVLIDLPLNDLAAYHSRHNALATLVLRADQNAEAYGAIECAEDGRIHRFLHVRLPITGKSRGIRMFTGVQILEPAIFAHMEEGKAFSLTQTTYVQALGRGQPMFGFDYFGLWQDLGTPERIKEAEARLVSGEVTLHYLE